MLFGSINNVSVYSNATNLMNLSCMFYVRDMSLRISIFTIVLDVVYIYITKNTSTIELNIEMQALNFKIVRNIRDRR